MNPFRKSNSGLASPNFRRILQIEDAGSTPLAALKPPTDRFDIVETAKPRLLRPLPPRPQTPWLPATYRQRAIAIAARVMMIAGDTAAGLLISQLIYWTRRGSEVEERDGWVFKTADDWQHETGMSWKMQARARSLLVEAGLIEERRRTMPSRLEFRLQLDLFGRRLAERAEIDLDEPLTVSIMRNDPGVDELLGRSFLYHGGLARLVPVPAAMLCSRLMAVSRVASLEPEALGRGPTKLVSLQRDRWRQETGLTRDQWETARKHLRQAGVLIERRHNYPRRVDLAIHLGALSEQLRLAQEDADRPARPRAARIGFEARWDWAKQVGGIGHRPIPPSQSPDPADSDRPKHPLMIARSTLYPTELQKLQLQLPQRAPDLDRAPATAGWGGGGFYGQVEVRMRAAEPLAMAKPVEPSVAAGTAERDGLAWPVCFAEGDRHHAWAHLARIDGAQRQVVLDEIDWLHGGTHAVRSPVALVRSLCSKVKAAQFLPEGAHRVAERRSAVAVENQRRKEEAARQAQADADGRQPDSAQVAEDRARLVELRRQMHLRAGGKA